jgi:hypothetical protein
MLKPAVALLAAALAVSACSSDGAVSSAATPTPEAAGTSAAPTPRDDDGDTAQVKDLADGTALVPGADAPSLALAATQAVYDEAPLVVLGSPADPARAAAVGDRASAPVLLTGDAVAGELERLGTQTVLAADAQAARWAEDLDDVDVETAPADLGGLDEGEAPESRDGVVALASTGSEEPRPAMATMRAAGIEVLASLASDPRADPALIATLADRSPTTVLALGDTFGEQEQLEARVATAMTGVQLPGGGQLILHGKRYVALYGHPGTSALGVLGEQGAEASVTRAAGLAAEYTAAGSDAQMIPTFEIITTIASAAIGADGDYSDESSIEHLRPYVDAAARSGVYVVLDLQPGYTDFLTQAKRYEELLALPHVGLALDPEWRLRPGERHMRQIGRVSAAEVNSVVDWLADFTRERKLPQKMLLLHQFKTFMLEDREQIDATRDELAVVTQMDGHGPTSTKLETWNTIRPGAPEGMVFGWKNFYDEDSPTLTPAQTLAVEPTPHFISYQ